MKHKWRTVFYITMMAGLGVVIYQIIKLGNQLEIPAFAVHPSKQNVEVIPQNHFRVFIDSLIHNLSQPISILLLQIIVIIACARFLGFLFKKIGQPAVIGEIVAGIILGPSILGLFFPEVNQFLFPAGSLITLQFMSQIGLLLFMFIIGMELDLSAIRKQAYDAVIISHASIIIPYTLGMGLAYFIYKEYAPATVAFLPFALFIGIAMSITAFPVLARILQEKKLTKTKLGAMTLTCAAADDLTAWCLLAAVIALVKSGSPLSVLFTFMLALLYVFVMLKMVHPFLIKLEKIYNRNEKKRSSIIAFLFIMLIISSYISSMIGIHALFGAFLTGVIMPSNFNFRKIVIDKIEDVSIILLLPLFFVISGLRTQIGLLNEGHMWTTFGWVLLVAVIGKFGGSAIAARMVGQNWKNSLSIGVLMNTRGLMQLIVLNIGYDLGIISAPIFAMMVLMALVTTFMAVPALNLINWMMPEKSPEKDMNKNPEPVIENQIAL